MTSRQVDISLRLGGVGPTVYVYLARHWTVDTRLPTKMFKPCSGIAERWSAVNVRRALLFTRLRVRLSLPGCERQPPRRAVGRGAWAPRHVLLHRRRHRLPGGCRPGSPGFGALVLQVRVVTCVSLCEYRGCTGCIFCPDKSSMYVNDNGTRQSPTMSIFAYLLLSACLSCRRPLVGVPGRNLSCVMRIRAALALNGCFDITLVLVMACAHVRQAM